MPNNNYNEAVFEQDEILILYPLTEIQEEDMVDGPGEKRVAEMCTYILIDSRDDLSISLTPHAIDIIMTVSKVCMCINVTCQGVCCVLSHDSLYEGVRLVHVLLHHPSCYPFPCSLYKGVRLVHVLLHHPAVIPFLAPFMKE